MKKRVTFTLDEKTIIKLKEASESSEVPQARIVERSILNEIKKMESTKK